MRTYRIYFFLCVVLSAILLNNNGCKKDQHDDSSTVSTAATTDAKITGTVKSPHGQVIGSAKIIAGSYKTISDRNGNFTLNVLH